MSRRSRSVGTNSASCRWRVPDARHTGAIALLPLTNRQLEVLLHSLGLDEYGRGRRYRNHFATDPESNDGAICRSLVDVGFMVDHGARELAAGMHVYSVTPTGEAAIAAQCPKPPKVSRSRQRYLDWLADDSGLSFREWIRLPRRSA
jgi:hypothetical protein